MNAWVETKVRSSIDGAVAIGLALAVLLLPWSHDEGWHSLIADRYAETGRFSYVLVLDDASYTLSKPWFYVLHIIGGGDWQPFLRRVPSALLSLGGWLLLRRCLPREGVAPAGVAYLVLALSFLVTLRQEPVAVAAMATTAWAVTRALAGSAGALAIAVPVAAVAAAVHPIGSAAAAWLAIAAILSRPSRPQWLALVAAVAVTAVPFAALVLWDLPIDGFRAAVSAISSLPSHRLGPLEEWWRYAYLILLKPWVMPVLAVGIGGLMWAPQPERRLLLGGAAVTLAILTMTPSKWEHHTGLWVPLVTLGIGHLATARPTLRRAALMAGLALVAVVATRQFSHVIESGGIDMLRRAVAGPSSEERQLGEVLTGRQVVMVPTFYPAIRGVRMAPLDRDGQRPDAVLLDGHNMHLTGLLASPTDYREALRFHIDDKPATLLLRQ